MLFDDNEIQTVNVRLYLNKEEGEVVLANSGASVGIGIADPGDNTDLHIHDATTGGGDSSQIVLTNTNTGSADSNGAAIRMGAGGSDFIFENQEDAATADILFKVNENGGSEITAMIIKNDGDVGIGTSSPVHELDVHGTIRAEEVIVEMFAPDYVFGDRYHLWDLDEVERYLYEKGHLPGVPSAEDMGGVVSIGDSHAILLQKVEELTLYLLEQRRRIDYLEKRLTTGTCAGKADAIGEVGR